VPWPLRCKSANYKIELLDFSSLSGITKRTQFDRRGLAAMEPRPLGFVDEN
jgi:hypothetical protein